MSVRVLLMVMLVVGVADARPLDSYFVGRPGCFVLFDVTHHHTVVRYNPERCKERLPPCSTFKVPLALMALDRGLVVDENTHFHWDGRDHGNPDWNRDQTARTWIHDSVVWVSQQLTPQLGTRTIAGYLTLFDYGNRDLSGGITQFWLSSSLRISADEQLALMRRLWTGDLPVSSHALLVTRRLTWLATSPHGWVLSGKTGSGHTDAGALGWFVGHLERPGQSYVLALNCTEPHPPGRGYPGLRARALASHILSDLGYW